MNGSAFLAAHDLPRRWQRRERFTLLAAGFGAGTGFLEIWRAWRDDPRRCENLVFIAIEPQPPSDAMLAAHEGGPWPTEADALRRAWPPLTPNLHRIAFEAGRVQLLLAIGKLSAWLPELVASVDAFELADAACDVRIAKALGRLAANDATLASGHAEPALSDALTSAGFAVQTDRSDPPGPRRTRARFAPSFQTRRARAPQRPATERHALIVGGGLAGCATAWALAEQGWRSTLIERHEGIATEASGNPAALFHGIVNASDGVHARLHRAAALAAHDAVRIAIDTHGVAGCTDGLLRLETAHDAAQMQALLDRLGLPPSYVQALSADAAGARAGLPFQHPAWFYPAGGWVDPAGLARSYLERAGAQTTRRHGDAAHRVQSVGAGWRVFDAQDRCLAEAPVLVLANAGDALRLLGDPGWPVERVRGQLSMMDVATAGIPLPALPIAGAGYVLPARDGELLFGATAHAADADPTLRLADQRANLAQLERLIGQPVAAHAGELRGRTAWRWSSRDRLPVIGAVPDPAPAPGARLDQPRLVPRLPGLYVFTALGSRGIGWSALGAPVLAAQIAAAPVPLEACLIDAIDPARFASRQARRAAAR